MDDPSQTECIYSDVNGDGVPDQLFPDGVGRFRIETYGYEWCEYYPIELDILIATSQEVYDVEREIFRSNYAHLWIIQTVRQNCFTDWYQVLKFQADEGHDYVLYRDPTPSADILDTTDWIEFYRAPQFGNQLRTVDLGLMDWYSAGAYYFVKLGRPIASMEIQLPWGTDPVVLSDWSSMQVYNTGGSVSMRVRDTAGKTIYSNQRLRWVVEDLETGEVILDATGVQAADIVALGEGRSVKVTVSLPGTNYSVNFFLDIVSGEVRPGAGGAPPNKIRKPDNSYVYFQERVSSCTIGALRNAIKLNGKEPPTEDEIIALLGAMGKNPIDFEMPLGTQGAGMPVEGSTTEARFDAILSPLGLDAVHMPDTTPEQFEAALRRGAIMIVGSETISMNPDGSSPPNANHAVVMRMVGDRVEVVDSATGKAKKLKMADALKVPVFGGTPRRTGAIQEIKPKSP